MSKSLYKSYKRKSNILKSFPQIEEEPDLDRLDVGGGGEAGGDREVDRGQDHHAGDIDADDQLVFVSVGDVVGGLVDNVHQNLKDLETKL